MTFTSLSMSFQPDPEAPMIVAIRQVKLREIDYEDLTQTDHLVRHVLNGDLTLTEARRWLARIVSSGHHTPRWAVTLGWGVMCGGVAVQLGGSVTVMAIASLAAMSIDRLQLVMAKRRLPFFYQQVAGGLLAMLLTVGVKATGIPMDTSLVVTANIVMLLAGIGFMGAFQDAMTGLLHHGQRAVARSRARHRRHHRRRQRGPEHRQPPRRRRRRAGARPHERDRGAARRGRRGGGRLRVRVRVVRPPPFTAAHRRDRGRCRTPSTWRSCSTSSTGPGPPASPRSSSASCRTASPAASAYPR